VADDAIFTYVRSTVSGTWVQFTAKHGTAVRAPEWALTPAEKRALAEQSRESVMAAAKPAKKRGGKAAA
jgi:hypothetical protein